MTDTKTKNELLKDALSKVAVAQGPFWDALSELEALSGVNLLSSTDYTGYADPTDEDVATVLENEQDGAI